MQSFRKVIDRATSAILKYSSCDVFEEIKKTDDGNDYFLTRFACYMITMAADRRKEAVARGLEYFARLADAAHVALDRQAYQVERLYERDQLKEGTQSLYAAAEEAGVEDSVRVQ